MTDDIGQFVFPYVSFERKLDPLNLTILIVEKYGEQITCKPKRILPASVNDNIDLGTIILNKEICPAANLSDLSSSVTLNPEEDIFANEKRQAFARLDLFYNTILIRKQTNNTSLDGIMGFRYLMGPILKSIDCKVLSSCRIQTY